MAVAFGIVMELLVLATLHERIMLRLSVIPGVTHHGAVCPIYRQQADFITRETPDQSSAHRTGSI